MKNVLAVIVTYNRLTQLKKTVAAIEAQEADCDILLVNNASTDGTEDWALSLCGTDSLKTGAPSSSSPAAAGNQFLPNDFSDNPSGRPGSENRQFLYENTGANIGGAGGFQYGMRRGVELGYDAVWIMDDDAVPKPDTLEQLLRSDAALSDENGVPSYGFLSSVVRWTDGSLCEMNRQRLPSHYVQEEDIQAALSRSEQLSEEYAAASHEKTQQKPETGQLSEQLAAAAHEKTQRMPKSARMPVECATFVSLLIPKETILRVGLPIKEFFIWSDDVEYTSRITRRFSLPAFLIPESEILHETKNNVGSDIVIDDAERIDRYRYAYRNGCYAYRHFSARMYVSFLYHTMLTFFRIFVKAKDHKGKRARVLLKGLFQGFVFHPKVEYVEPKNP